MISSPVVRLTGTCHRADLRLSRPLASLASLVRRAAQHAPDQPARQNLADRLSRAIGLTFGTMAPSTTASRDRRQRKPPSAAQTRIIEAALREFAKNGVGGTSLQMIADDIGVTKAAVYHQYKTKDEIVRAVAGAEFDRLETVLDLAESEVDQDRAREVALTMIIDLAVERRRENSTILTDPLVGRLFARDQRPVKVLDRLNRLLMGPNAATGLRNRNGHVDCGNQRRRHAPAGDSSQR